MGETHNLQIFDLGKQFNQTIPDGWTEPFADKSKSESFHPWQMGNSILKELELPLNRIIRSPIDMGQIEHAGRRGQGIIE